MKMSFLPRLKKICRRTLEWLKLQRESSLDAHRYFRAASWAGPVKRHELYHIESDLIKHYHVLEKGLAMADFRPRSGIEVLKRLVVLTSIWRDAGGDERHDGALSSEEVLGLALSSEEAQAHHLSTHTFV